MVMCAMLDYPYIAEVFTSVQQSAPVFSFGVYCRQLNNRQYGKKTIEYSIFSGEFGKTEESIQEQKELTYLMRDLRNKDIKQIEEDYYAQLKSEGTEWAAHMSAKALMTNANFDENDVLDIRNKRAALIENQYAEIDDLKEQNRRLMEMVQKLGGDLSALDEPSAKK